MFNLSHKSRIGLKHLHHKTFLVIMMTFGLCISEAIANTTVTKPSWYRYYDKNGVANISSSVTPEHIRHGYEALDRNMQVIKKNRPYDADKEQQQSGVRTQQAKQHEQDLRLKRAYGSSKVAANKRDDMLKNINKQITFQKQQYQQLEQDRILFKKQEQTYIKKGNPVPKNLQDRITYNAQNMSNIQKNIESLQTNYRNTQSQYDNIIKRLKTLE
ncbi:hypothetical protein [Acinetobacter sp. DSM 11652]|uniref:hypothetical protein n=1 Tax=Acinetobacter sp. DSM 11652 TaxID=346222 RepID=UPI0008C09F7E|nr:hypothetical protein [Acinetobacter sp. DSM 11652]SEL83417.1 hypothetical protein SAMN05216500_10667 [Acinetobacter sp. DSM 11652]